MNIFVTSSCPIESAKYLDNKRVVKMVLESAQMLSTAIRLNGYKGMRAYKIVSKNHPCNIWVRTSRGNYKWLIEHFKALSDEYTRRYGKVHKSFRLYDLFLNKINLIPEGKLTEFTNCAANKEHNICFKHVKNVHKAYKKYLKKRWEMDKRKPVWS